MTANAILRAQLDSVLSQAPAEKQWWEKRRGQIQSDFMKELDGDNAGSEPESSAKGVSEDDAIVVDSPAPTAAATTKGKKKGGKK